MSTNFYWLTEPREVRVTVLDQTFDIGHTEALEHELHIGQRFGMAKGQMGFIWAQKPDVVRAACQRAPQGLAIARDEYDREYTGAELLDVFSNFVDEQLAIGQRFS